MRTQEAQGARERSLAVCACGLRYMLDLHESRDEVYGEHYGGWSDAPDGSAAAVREAKKCAFREQLRTLRERLPSGARLLDVGTGVGLLLDVATDMGLEAHGVEPSEAGAACALSRHPGRVRRGALSDARYPDAWFDAVTLIDVLEHVDEPHALMKEIARILAPGGWLLIITPDTDGFTHAVLGSRWFQYKYEHVTYWNARTVGKLLAAHGMRAIEARGNVKRFNLAYYRNYFEKYAFPPFDRMLRAC